MIFPNDAQLPDCRFPDAPRPKSSRSRSVRLAVLGGLLLLAAPAAAQTGGTLPLVSVGDKWPQAQETYVIRVSAQDAGKPLGLEVFSPTFNLADYVDGRRAEGTSGMSCTRRTSRSRRPSP